MKTKKLNIRVTPTFLQKFKKLAEERNETMTQFFTYLVNEFLKNK